MGLDEVTDEILDEADRHASEIEREAEEKAEKIVEEAEEEAEEIRESAREEAESQAESIEKQELSSGKLGARMEQLKAQREVLADAREEALRKLADMEGEEREKLVEALLEQADAEMEAGDIYAAPSDEDLVKDDVGDRFAGTVDAVGGIRVEKSGVALDLTFDTLLDQAWEKKLPEVSKKLFGE